jgi:hypothetical protein
MITLTREEAQQVLDALEDAADHIGCPDDDDAIGVARRTLRARLAQPEPEPVAWMMLENKLVPIHTAPPQRGWQNAALRLGEELSTVGPDGYYNMTAQQWLDWAMKNITPARLAEPYRGQAEAVFAETNGRIRIDPVTGNVGIGWASGPEKSGGE